MPGKKKGLEKKEEPTVTPAAQETPATPVEEAQQEPTPVTVTGVETETEVDKAIKALEAAARKAGRAGIDVKMTYTVVTEGKTATVRCLLADRN